MPMNTAKLLLLNVLGGSAPSFSPLDIPGLTLWLDASDSATLFQDSAGTTPATADNDPVGYWGDKSGNGKHVTQGTAGARPLLKTAALGGKNAILWDTSDDLLVNVSFSVSQPNTIFMAVKMGTLGTRTIFDGSVDRQQSYNDAGKFWMRATTALDMGAASANTPTLLTYLFNGASSFGRVNGVQTASGNASTNALTGLRVGNEATGIGFGGHIAEALIYSGQLSAAQITAVETYLNGKWLLF